MHLSLNEKNDAESYLIETNPEYYPLYLSFLAHDNPFPSSRFFPAAIESTPPVTWWRALRSSLKNDGFIDFAVQLLTSPASSASIERVFSTFDLIHTKARNRLGVERAAKLVFCYRHLKSVDLNEDDIDDDDD